MTDHFANTTKSNADNYYKYNHSYDSFQYSSQPSFQGPSPYSLKNFSEPISFRIALLSSAISHILWSLEIFCYIWVCTQRCSLSSFKYPQPPCSLASNRAKAILFCNVRLSYWSTIDRFIGIIIQGLGSSTESGIGRQAIMLDSLCILPNPSIQVNIEFSSTPPPEDLIIPINISLYILLLIYRCLRHFQLQGSSLFHCPLWVGRLWIQVQCIQELIPFTFTADLAVNRTR